MSIDTITSSKILTRMHQRTNFWTFIKKKQYSACLEYFRKLLILHMHLTRHVFFINTRSFATFDAATSPSNLPDPPTSSLGSICQFLAISPHPPILETVSSELSDMCLAAKY